MSEQMLELLKLCLLALLYLFLLRVVWAVATQLRTPLPVGPDPGVRDRGTGRTRAVGRNASVPTRLVVVAPKAREGLSYPLADGLSLGRAPGNAVTIDDTFVSQAHARVLKRADGWWFEDLRSTNGSFHNGVRVNDATALRLGDRLQLGDTIMELR